MNEPIFAVGSTITVNTSVPATVQGLKDAFAFASPHFVKVGGYKISFPTDASDFISNSALRKVIDKLDVTVGSDDAVLAVKRARTTPSQMNSLRNIRVRSQILFGQNAGSSFNGVGRVKVTIGGPWTAELYYQIPYAVPATALGKTFIKETLFGVNFTIKDLVFLFMEKGSRHIKIMSFFYGTPESSVSAARKVAASYGRTLPGMAMDWIKAVAVSVGAETIDLVDEWKGFQGLTSKHLQGAARQWPTTKYLLRRAERTNPDRSNPSDPKYTEKYMKRIRKGGYYGQFGFVDESVDVQDLVYVNASFVDACM